MPRNRRKNVVHASDCTCCEEGCKNKAVAFWPMIDPDIPHYPYCRECLDKAKLSLLAKLSDEDLI